MEQSDEGRRREWRGRCRQGDGIRWGLVVPGRNVSFTPSRVRATGGRAVSKEGVGPARIAGSL